MSIPARLSVCATVALALGLATPIAAHDFWRDNAVVDGRLQPGDVDRFSFRLHDGEILTASLWDAARGEFNDPLLGVFAPDGSSLPSARSDDDGPGFLPSLALRTDRSGWWTVAVTGFGDDAFDGSGHAQDFDYRLVVGVAHEPPRLVEREDRGGNDEIASADWIPLLHGATVVSGRLVSGDVDVYEVWLLPGATLVASVFDLERGEFHDSVLRLRDRDGVLLGEDDDGGPGFLSSLTFDAPDLASRRFWRLQRYYVEVTGFDPVSSDARPHRESFDYELAIGVDLRN
jgi:hypothetical protein